MAVDRPDLCIIGADPGGFAVAEAARARGASVMRVLPDGTRDVSPDLGTLAAHALAASARRAHQVRHARMLGIGADEPRINFARVNAHVKSVLAEAVPESATERLTALGVETVSADAGFTDPRTLVAGDRTIRARRFVLATGSYPAIPEIPGIDAVPFHTPQTVSEITRRPSHLIVLGGGATGTMLAQAHLRLGCAVTLIDMLDPLRDCDPELAEVVLRRLRAEGLEILANTGVVSVSGDEGGLVVEVKSGAREAVISGSHLLVAVGRRPAIAGLGLEKARLRFDPRGLVLHDGVRTFNRRIYCVGAVTGLSLSLHETRLQAGSVVERTLGFSRPVLDEARIPRVVHTDPEVAWIGHGEAQACWRFGNRFTVLRYPFAQVDRARALGETEGHVKLMVHADGRILGAAVAGPQAGELIGLFALAMRAGMSPAALGELAVPYPTLAEIAAHLASQYRTSQPPKPWTERLTALKRLLP